ncbi:hypothetical protein BSF44_46860 [Pseudomonas sp. ACN8]|nr:hypothetical protein BSF44_46860 [Pseudomonas sp. ACN8]
MHYRARKGNDTSRFGAHCFYYIAITIIEKKFTPPITLPFRMSIENCREIIFVIQVISMAVSFGPVCMRIGIHSNWFMAYQNGVSQKTPQPRYR